MLDSCNWKSVDDAAAISFDLDLTPPSRRPQLSSVPDAGRAAIVSAEGIVTRVEDGRLTLRPDASTDEEIGLSFQLPKAIDLSPLGGERIRVTVWRAPLPNGLMSQRLTIADESGAARLVASFGPAQGNVHTMQDVTVRAALSQRPGGPLVFGTDSLQWLVHVGQRVEVREGSRAFVMHFIARTPAGYASYLIADRGLWT